MLLLGSNKTKIKADMRIACIEKAGWRNSLRPSVFCINLHKSIFSILATGEANKHSPCLQEDHGLAEDTGNTQFCTGTCQLHIAAP